MMKFRTVSYFFSAALKSTARNSLMSITSMATVAACIFIVVFSYCLAVNIDYLLEQVEETIGISAIIDDRLSGEEVNALYEDIRNMAHVVDVEYITAQKALENFAESLGDSKDFLKGLENDNPLRRSFVLTLDNIKNQDVVCMELKSTAMSDRGIVSVREAKEVTEILIAANNAIRISSIFVILLLGLLSVVIIINTIKLTVNSRRNEIGIMKYVGATDWFIKWPFVLEGVVIGMLGAFAPVLIGIFVYDRTVDSLLTNQLFGNLFGMFDFYHSIDIFPGLAPVVVILGASIGVIGSLTSIRKYLDV